MDYDELRKSIIQQSVNQERSTRSDDSLSNSSEHGTESTTKEPAPTSSEDGASSLDSRSDYSGEDENENFFSENESVSSRIGFLREKQQLLKRASDHFAREDVYNAFNAVNDAQSSSLISDESPIWKEARQFLKESETARSVSSSVESGDSDSDSNNNNKTGGGTATVVSSSLSSSTGPSRGLPFVTNNKKRSSDMAIDTSQVDRITSKAYEREEENSNSSSDKLPSTPSLQMMSTVNMMFRQGNWMAQALVMSSSTAGPSASSNTAAEGNNSWEVVSDPRTSSLGLVPPHDHSSLLLSDSTSVTLQEAMEITDTPQLVAQSMPPFAVVSANKAFLQLAGLPSSRKIIGEPIESILQVSPPHNHQAAVSGFGGAASKDHSSSLLLPSVLWIGGEGSEATNKPSNSISSKSCSLTVKPVVVHNNNANKRRRLLTNPSSPQSSSYMSHLLVVVHEATELQQQAPVVLSAVG